jgi:hypothetical protein
MPWRTDRVPERESTLFLWAPRSSYRHSIIVDKTFGETTAVGADDGAGLRHADLSVTNSVGTPAVAAWSGKSIDRGQTKSKPMIRDIVRTDRTA